MKDTHAIVVMHNPFSTLSRPKFWVRPIKDASELPIGAPKTEAEACSTWVLCTGDENNMITTLERLQKESAATHAIVSNILKLDEADQIVPITGALRMPEGWNIVFKGSLYECLLNLKK